MHIEQSRIDREAAVPSAIAKSIGSLAELPHYEGVQALHRAILSENHREVASQALDLIAGHDPTRAAILFCDCVGMSIPQERSEAYRRPLEKPAALGQKFAAILDQCQFKDQIRDEIRKLPLVDATYCREFVLGLKGLEAYGPSKAAELLIAHPSDVERYHAAQRGECTFFDPAQLDPKRFDLATDLFHPICDNPHLSPRNQELLAAWRDRIAPPLFPVERYGYGALHETLEVVSRRKEVVAVKIPFGERLDSPAPHSHQCADAASATRSFFVARGIPTDVYVMSVGGINHNVAVVYFSEGEKFQPVVVDVSPFGGFYTVENRDWTPDAPTKPGADTVRFANPLGSLAVFDQRGDRMPVVLGDFAWDQISTGLAPWFGCDLPSGKGRLIGFGGVVAFQEGASWLSERGTPEFYGAGVRDPYVGFHLALMIPSIDGATPKIFKIMAGDRRGEPVLEIPHEQPPSDLLAESVERANEMMPALHDFIRRVGISLERRVFSDSNE
jgi:hypothetical protein